VVVFRLRQPELRQDVPHVLLHRSLREPKLGGDAGVRAPFGHQGQHLALASRELRQRVSVSSDSDECLHETRVDDGSARRDPLKCIHELVHRQDAALEQVADPIPGREELCRILDLDMRREDEDAGLGKLLTNRLRCGEPFGGMRRRHADVDDDELGLVLAHEREQFGRVAGLADDLEVAALEQARQPFAEEDIVVCDDDPRAALQRRVDNASTLRGRVLGD
jgi:hypothetical protein